MVGGSTSKYVEVKLPYIHVKQFFKIPETMYILPTALNPTFRSFLKSMNLKLLIISPNNHSTDTRTLLIDLLNASISGFSTTIRKGACRWTRRGYAGSPYKHIGSPSELKACASSISKILESRNIPESCSPPLQNSLFINN